MLGEEMLVMASSSDIIIKIWKVFMDMSEEVECVGSIDTTCRMTCMSVWHCICFISLVNFVNVVCAT